MTRILAQLLGVEQLSFNATIQKLEQAAARPSKDIRLTSEITHTTRQKLRELGLDPTDTTGQELYQALLQRFGRDEQLVRTSLGVKDDATISEFTQAAITFVQKTLPKRDVLALKQSVARRLFKKVPPKRTMKQLGYRSLDSMLKHETPAQIYVAAHLCESTHWRRKFLDHYSQLQAHDFELRPIAIVSSQAQRWKKFASYLKSQGAYVSVAAVKEMGAVVVLADGSNNIQALRTVTSLVEACNDIHSTASFLKLQQMTPNFGLVAKKAAEHEPLIAAELITRPVPWRVVHQYYARFKDKYNPVIFEPHIRAQDISWMHPEVCLKKLHPALSFWDKTHYSAYIHKGKQISFNIFDVAANYYNRFKFDQQRTEGVQRSLWQELMIQYLDHTNVEQAISRELEPDPVFVEIDE